MLNRLDFDQLVNVPKQIDHAFVSISEDRLLDQLVLGRVLAHNFRYGLGEFTGRSDAAEHLVGVQDKAKCAESLINLYSM